MESEEPEIILSKIGEILSRDPDYPGVPTLLYAELDFNMVGQSIFIDLGNHILYRWGGHELTYILLDLWGLADPEKRWAEIEYVIRDGRFEVSFIYPEDIDAGIDSFDRRDRIVEKYFGEKPIHYPPLPTIDNYSFDL